jgi:hypothetical protein
MKNGAGAFESFPNRVKAAAFELRPGVFCSLALPWLGRAARANLDSQGADMRQPFDFLWML